MRVQGRLASKQVFDIMVSLSDFKGDIDQFEERITGISEHDFLIKAHGKLHLIECKVFRMSGSTEDDKNFNKKVQAGISQLIKHMSEVNADSAIFVCNPCRVNKEDLDKWIETAMKEFEVSINKDKISVIGPDDLSKTLKKLI